MDSTAQPADSTSPLRVLVLDEEPPWPLDSGKRIRTWYLLTELARRHCVTFVAYGQRDSDAARALARTGIEFVPVSPRRLETGPWLYARMARSLLSREPFSVWKHHRRRFQRTVSRLIASRPFDLIHCEWTPYAQFVPPRTPDRLIPPLLIATHNIEADIWARRAETRSHPLARRFFRSQAARMERFERRVFAQADCVTAVSAHDAARTSAWGARQTGVVANGVATDVIRPALLSDKPAQDLLFLGSLDWFPNIDALRYFVSEILPLIRSRVPEIRLNIVGRRPGAELRQILNGIEGTTLVGEVDDVQPWLHRVRVVVVPLRIGGGTRIKILEAMAAGKIVVSTSVGAEGLEVESGIHLLLADTPPSFADATVEALHGRGAQLIPSHARQLVEERYSWRLQATRLEQAWRRTAAHSAAES